LINNELGFRNFNAFLNHHRIVDACQRLADPTKKEVAILDLALEVGFGSITSFNDAFKKQLNMTPTAYRKQKMAQLA
jgi:AraC-like DNA-binding protein